MASECNVKIINISDKADIDCDIEMNKTNDGNNGNKGTVETAVGGNTTINNDVSDLDIDTSDGDTNGDADTEVETEPDTEAEESSDEESEGEESSGDDSEYMSGGGSDCSTTELLAADPLYFVLSKVFMPSDGTSLGSVLEDISHSLKAIAKQMKKKNKK